MVKEISWKLSKKRKTLAFESPIKKLNEDNPTEINLQEYLIDTRKQINKMQIVSDKKNNLAGNYESTWRLRHKLMADTK